MVVGDRASLEIEGYGPPPEVQLGPGRGRVAPNAVFRFAFPQRFGERWTVVGRVGLGAEQPDLTCRIRLADRVGGGVGCHAAADDEIRVIEHRVAERSVARVARGRHAPQRFSAATVHRDYESVHGSLRRRSGA